MTGGIPPVIKTVYSLHQWTLNKANEAKLKIDQREDKIQIGDRIICFSLFLYFYFILTHISSEYQSYIYQVMQKFKGDISGHICLQKCARYLGTRPGGPSRCGCQKYWIFEAGTRTRYRYPGIEQHL
jgi:hypothetical protein